MFQEWGVWGAAAEALVNLVIEYTNANLTAIQANRGQRTQNTTPSPKGHHGILSSRALLTVRSRSPTEGLFADARAEPHGHDLFTVSSLVLVHRPDPQTYRYISGIHWNRPANSPITTARRNSTPTTSAICLSSHLLLACSR